MVAGQIVDTYEKHLQRFHVVKRVSDAHNNLKYGMEMSEFPHGEVEYDPIILEQLPFKLLRRSFVSSTLTKHQVLDEYMRISPEMKEQASKYSVKAGKLSRNVSKNRYSDIVPFDYNRGRLKSDEDFYLNASYIKGFNNEVCLVASQGPKEDTVEDFYRFVVSSEIQHIAMIGKLAEVTKAKNGDMVENVKCHKYWPDLNETLTLTRYIVKNIYEDKTNPHVTLRTLLLKNNPKFVEDTPLSALGANMMNNRNKRENSKGMTITQYQIHGWDDKEHPNRTLQPIVVHTILNLLWMNPRNPIVVHCSAGVGRTGIFCAIYLFLSSLAQMLIPSRVHSRDLLRHLRYQRKSMIQTKSQYLFTHDILESTKLMLQALLDEAVKPKKDSQLAIINDFGMPSLKKFVGHHVARYLNNEMLRKKYEEENGVIPIMFKLDDNRHNNIHGYKNSHNHNSNDNDQNEDKDDNSNDTDGDRSDDNNSNTDSDSKKDDYDEEEEEEEKNTSSGNNESEGVVDNNDDSKKDDKDEEKNKNSSGKEDSDSDVSASKKITTDDLVDAADNDDGEEYEDDSNSDSTEAEKKANEN